MPTKEKQLNRLTLYGMIILSLGILHAIGIFHDLRLIFLGFTSLPAKSFKQTALQITSNISLSVGYVIMLAGIISIIIGQVDRIGAAIKEWKK